MLQIISTSKLAAQRISQYQKTGRRRLPMLLRGICGSAPSCLHTHSTLPSHGTTSSLVSPCLLGIAPSRDAGTFSLARGFSMDPICLFKGGGSRSVQSSEDASSVHGLFRSFQRSQILTQQFHEIVVIVGAVLASE